MKQYLPPLNCALLLPFSPSWACSQLRQGQFGSHFQKGWQAGDLGEFPASVSLSTHHPKGHEWLQLAPGPKFARDGSGVEINISFYLKVTPFSTTLRPQSIFLVAPFFLILPIL